MKNDVEAEEAVYICIITLSEEPRHDKLRTWFFKLSTSHATKPFDFLH